MLEATRPTWFMASVPFVTSQRRKGSCKNGSFPLVHANEMMFRLFLIFLQLTDRRRDSRRYFNLNGSKVEVRAMLETGAPCDITKGWRGEINNGWSQMTNPKSRNQLESRCLLEFSPLSQG